MAWPDEELLLEHDFGVEVPIKDVEFQEIDKWKLPNSYSGINNYVIFYKRAYAYLK